MAYYYSPFRKQYEGAPRPKDFCVFCDEGNILRQTVRDAHGNPVENEHYRWIVNFFPTMEGHTMVVPKAHVIGFRGESKDSLADRQSLLAYAYDRFIELYPGAGVEVFHQTGIGSISSVPHIHWHIVPARPDDPLRAFQKLGHFFVTEEGEETILRFPHKIQYAREELLAALAPLVTAVPW